MLDETRTCDPDFSTEETGKDLLYYILLGTTILVAVVFIGVVIWQSRSHQ